MAETPAEWLDRLDDRSLEDEARAAILEAIVRGFSPDRIADALRGRFIDLAGPATEVTLRLLEAFGAEPLYRELADAARDQPNLSADRAWEVLSILDAAGLVEDDPALKERWDDLNETIDDDSSLPALAGQLEHDRDGIAMALQGLAAVEPEVRAQIVAGLAENGGGPKLVDFFRLLTFAHDPATSSAALDALDRLNDDGIDVAPAWRSIVAAHPDAKVVARAADKIGGAKSTDLAVPWQMGPTTVRTLITGIDGDGRATIVMAARDGTAWAAAAFLCHATRGIVDVLGQEEIPDLGLDDVFEALNDQAKSEILEAMPELARRLLAGSLSLCGTSASPALRYWIERTIGPEFHADRGAIQFAGTGVSPMPIEAMRANARLVLDACPHWADHSGLTGDLAREVALRGRHEVPDPRRDSGAYRYLFEHRLAGRIELYARMLLWMAAFWRGSGRAELAQAALGLASEIADPQHAVPGHPFFVELTTLSLSAAESR